MSRRKAGRGGRRREHGGHRSSPASVGRLCSEVERTLSLTLGDALDDDRLAEISIVDVVPAPDESRLRVEVAQSGDRPDGEVLALLQAAKGPLVRALADALSYRRRLPDLVFAIAAPYEPEPPDPPDESDGSDAADRSDESDPLDASGRSDDPPPGDGERTE